MSAGFIEFRKTFFPRNIWMCKATLFPQFVNSVEFATLNWLSTWLSVSCKLSSAAILSTAGNQFFLTQRFTCTLIQNPGSRTTYAVLMSSKKSKTAVYGCNPAVLKFYQCRVDVLQSQIFLSSQISLDAMFVITDFCWYVFLKRLRSILVGLHFCLGTGH